MIRRNLSSEISIVKCLAYADGSAVREGAIFDMQGWDGVLGICVCAAINNSAAGDIHWHQGNDSGLSDAADLEGTKIAIAGDDDDQIFASELCRPGERYVQMVVTKNTVNNQAETVIYIPYRFHTKPPTITVADLVTHELHVSPAEGTK